MKRSNQNPLRVLTCAILITAVTASYVQADLVTFAFEGQINDVDDEDNLLGGSVTVGMPFSGIYTFEASTPGMPAPSSFGNTIYDAITDVAGQASGIPFSIADHPVTASRDGIIVGDFSAGSGFISDTYRLLVPVDFAGFQAQFLLNLFDSQNQMFQDDSLPVVPPLLELTSRRRITIGEINQGFFVNAQLDSLELVPEPSTATVMLTAAAFFSLRRRHLKRFAN